ncbi:protein of unknown function - conserved [Leishmania donovani]|uniref:Hypothetical_protein_conserved n=1 Tax=Leishmania donovani TaxID=5661 RepID=A0A504XSC5_LEIDO|nr:hypothetical protein CGC20_15155 [Leishmania donovani]CAJ1993124.1 protein of unknown function - conserved [Leishmania donovani]VDZ48952.1 hypothetical_protein_conserved [Leishmania donovani]
MESKPNHRRVWVTSAVVLTALVTLIVRRRQQKRQLARRTAADAMHEELAEALKQSLLPVLVRPEDLPAGWGVAPPVFYPPYCAAIPLVLPREMQELERDSSGVRSASTSRFQGGGADGLAVAPTAFLFCSYTGYTAGPFATRQDEEVFLTEVLAHHPVLRERLAENPRQWSPLPESAPHASTDAKTAAAVTEGRRQNSFPRTFSHVLVSDDCVLLAGMNGPYTVVAVLTDFAGAWPLSRTARASADGEESGRRRTGSVAPPTIAEETELSDAIEGIACATINVPLATLGSDSAALAFRVPGTCFAAHQGYYRVVCAREGRELELCVPPEWTMRSECVNTSCTTPAGPPVPARKPVSTVGEDAESKGIILTLSFIPSSFMSEGRVDVCISAELFSALYEEPQAAAATLWAASGATDVCNPVAKATLGALTARPLPASSHARTNVVTMVYVQPKFGVLFSVHPRSAVVYEPWMTEQPTILYYPLGDAADDEGSPRMTIEYVVELPKTWEVFARDDEEFVHNVLFHFTSGEAAAISTTLTEISGIRCAMFHETRESRRCRTYVLPRGATLLVIRWETLAESWDKDLPVFQQTLDTLHIDAAAVIQ